MRQTFGGTGGTGQGSFSSPSKKRLGLQQLLQASPWISAQSWRFQGRFGTEPTAPAVRTREVKGTLDVMRSLGTQNKQHQNTKTTKKTPRQTQHQTPQQNQQQPPTRRYNLNTLCQLRGALK